MAGNDFSHNDRLRTVEEIVDDTVTFFRNRGHKRDVALEQTALALGLTPRRTRRIFYGEAVALLGVECRQIRQAFVCHLEKRADEYALKSETVRARLRQMQMEI